ncbi:MAG TPA: bifunctional 3,4-dihydroxy-2-butanone-4-phosphate synthase/GTP cyclohydrolase II [Candidatus Eisenbacteria bacterium]|nr:bifunctional 3,4-dihydroxy-2-butanone-4-phosphate synthase/GTP cyclohydrolase II [Candidatus Eisenbacteria bacterium]
MIRKLAKQRKKRTTAPAVRGEAAKDRAVERVVRDIRRGRMVVVVDDEQRENEGDLIMAAEKATPETVNFMVTHGRGLLCVPLDEEQADRLELFPMSPQNTALHGTSFTVSVDAIRGTTTGISAADRAATVRRLADPRAEASEFARPGHVFPLRGVRGGVLRRAGHTEATLDLVHMAGLRPAGLLCEIMDPDGSMMRMPALRRFCRRHRLPVITVRDLIAYRRRREKLVRRLVKTTLPTPEGRFDLHLYESTLDGDHHVALTMGDVAAPGPVLVRVHSQCLTGDVFGSQRCDCGEQMRAALRAIAARGRGVFLYMRQEGRGIGLANKIRAYALQDKGLDTVEANLQLGFPADLRDYGIGAQILYDLGVRELELLTNNPRKIVGLEAYGLNIARRVPLQMPSHAANRNYLVTKRDKLGHLLDLPPGLGSRRNGR